MKGRIVNMFWTEGDQEKQGECLVPEGFDDTDCARGYIEAANATRSAGHPVMTFLRAEYIRDFYYQL